MNRFNRVRKPVKRHGAERYLLLTLLSFAASISLTRLFLQLTGYPKLGNGSLHIAHVLWGGLLLFSAALLPLILANRWAYDTSSLLAGAGVGLFIDEVGKFITQNNNYFYPPAAPIIYAFFLITVLVYLEVRRPSSREPRNELYHALDSIEEVLDRDLEEQERDELDRRLLWISAQTELYPDFASLALELHNFLHNQDVLVIPDQQSWIERWQSQMEAWTSRHIDRARLRVIIILGLSLTGIIALTQWGIFLKSNIGPASFQQTLVDTTSPNATTAPAGIYWFIARVVLEGGVGILLLTGSVLITLKQVRRGMTTGYYGLLLSLTTVDLLLFYINQFQTILIAILQFMVLMGLIYYRKGNPKPIAT